jgi:MFS family permease
MPVATSPAAEPASSLRDPRLRLPAIGLVIVVTVVAVEAMAVATIMPTVVRALHGLRLYGWGFTAYLLADVVGMVFAGRDCDRHGPSRSLLGGLTVFAGGLVVASIAPDIWVFLAGRVLQGLGGGAMIVAAYVVVARAFPDNLHPRVFAALSAAWVVPSLVGPAVAGLVASAWSWRWVFAGIAPLAVGGAMLLVPVLRRLPRTVRSESSASAGLWLGVVLACALGLVQAAAEAIDAWSIPLLVGGVGLGLFALRRLLPTGTLRLASGLPAVVALRGILTCAFFGAEAYLPLTLARIHGGSARVVGIPLTLAALGWSAGSWWQGRRTGHRLALMRTGFLGVAVGVGLLSIVAAPAVSMWLAIPVWTVAGTGMGVAMPTISVLLLERSTVDRQGANSAALQISDMVGSIVGIAAAGALVQGFGLGRLSTAIVVADLILAMVAVFGASVAVRAFPAVTGRTSSAVPESAIPGSRAPAAARGPHP